MSLFSKRINIRDSGLTADNVQSEFDHLYRILNKFSSSIGYTVDRSGQATLEAKIVTKAGSIVHGGSLVDGSVIASKIIESQQTFSTNITFYQADNKNIHWIPGGNITLANGRTYTIPTDMGNITTGIVQTTSPYYIYFNYKESKTSLKWTSDYSEAIGDNCILLCVFMPRNIGAATFDSDIHSYVAYVPAVGTLGLNGVNISVNSITTGMLTANCVTAAKIYVLSLSSMTTETGTLEIGTSGYLKGGQTDYNTGTGFWMGYKTDKYKFSIGDPTADHMTWDGSLAIFVGTGNNIFKVDSNGIYLGHATFASAPFRVTPAGALTATSATITGAVTTTSGSIAGLTISSDALTITAAGKTTKVSSGSTAFSAGTTATPEFSVTDAGALTATNATITSSGTSVSTVISAGETSYKEGSTVIVRIGANVASTTGGLATIGKITVSNADVGNPNVYIYCSYPNSNFGGFTNIDSYIYATTNYTSSFYGIKGRSAGEGSDTTNYGVYGSATSGKNCYGVYGVASGGSTVNYAGYFSGDVHITGALTLGNSTYVTSAYGSLTAYSPSQYLCDASNVHQQEVKKRSLTINGVTVTLLCID